MLRYCVGEFVANDIHRASPTRGQEFPVLQDLAIAEIKLLPATNLRSIRIIRNMDVHFDFPAFIVV
jgi:hypothetical protein